VIDLNPKYNNINTDNSNPTTVEPKRSLLVLVMNGGAYSSGSGSIDFSQLASTPGRCPSPNTATVVVVEEDEKKKGCKLNRNSSVLIDSIPNTLFRPSGTFGFSLRIAS